MGVWCNKAVIVEQELKRAKEDKDSFYSWFFVSEEPYKEFTELLARNPNAWQPQIEDVINEIANYYGGSYEEYQAISEYLNEIK